MAEKITPVTLEMFRPRVEDRSEETNAHIARLLGLFSGRDSLRFYKEMRTGRVLSDEAVAEIDRYALRSIKKYFHLPEASDPQEFYLQQQKQAIGLIEYYGELLPEEKQNLALKNEISLLSDSPSDLLRLLSRPSETIDPTLAFEAHRHALCLYDLGQMNARTKRGRLRTVLSRVHQIFNEKLFEGPEGAGSKFVLESIHDDETNEVIGFLDEDKPIPPTAHLKRTPLIVRKIPDAGLVYTSPRKKDDRIALVKTIAKSQHNGGVLNIEADVLDGIGIMIVLLENRMMPEELAQRTVSILKDDPRIRVRKIEVEDETSTDHGQSPKYKHLCRRIWQEDVPTPIELKFQDRRNYLNSILEVGDRDEDTGLYMGRAHELFELRRANQAARILFPPEIYPQKLEYAFVKRSVHLARVLRDRYKADR